VSSNPNNGVAAFSTSNTGTLVYRTGSLMPSGDLTWFDRTGNKLNVVQAVGNFINMGISPDQTHIAAVKADDNDIWSIDLLRGTNSRFTFDGTQNNWPVFSADGKQILFVSNRSGKNNLYVRNANGVGAAERLNETLADGVSDWSGDGKFVLFAVNAPWDVWILPMTGDRKPYPLLNDPKSFEYRAKFSPDGRWFLYTSNETGRNEIYVQTFPPSGGKWQVSVEGGEHAYWRRDGKEIVFSTSDNKIMSVETNLATTFEASIPRQLFQIPNAVPSVRFAITPNAQKFLVPVNSSQTGAPSSLTAVLNWTSDLKN
jgi:eukaryotic-like serine/threonine-protein kinase